jgi:uncharacterized membrane-anchored protein
MALPSIRGSQLSPTGYAPGQRGAPPAAHSGERAPITGIARKGRRTKALVKHLRPGDIAIIDHQDIDSLAAVALIERRVAAVIDAAPPISGRYPNRGPAELAQARIPLFHLTDPALFDTISEGRKLVISSDGSLFQDGNRIGCSEEWSAERIEAQTAGARANLSSELEKFAVNTLFYVQGEKNLLLDPVNIPQLAGVRPIQGKHVAVVVRGEGYREDLQSIRGYLKDVRPVIVAVDGAADALLECKIKPDIILGDMDSVSDKALHCGAKLVVHAYADTGHAPGMERVNELGLAAEKFPVSGTSEDAALLLAYEKGAKLIVAVGTHTNLEDFLDKGRAGMASTFLVRLKAGSRLVDARGVSQLHRTLIGPIEMSALLLSAIFVGVVIFMETSLWHMFLDIVRFQWHMKLLGIARMWWHLRSHMGGR